MGVGSLSADALGFANRFVNATEWFRQVDLLRERREQFDRNWQVRLETKRQFPLATPSGKSAATLGRC